MESTGPKSVTKSSAAPRSIKPAPGLLEVLERGRLQGQVVEPAPPEHRRLALRLGVPLDLEHVELCLLPRP